MKDDVHPDYDFITVELNDGTSYRTRSTMDRETFAPEVDATNHPFYTGKQRQVSRTGQVERFMKKYGMEEDDVDATSEAASDGSGDEDSERPERAKIDPETGEVLTDEEEDEDTHSPAAETDTAQVAEGEDAETEEDEQSE